MELGRIRAVTLVVLLALLGTPLAFPLIELLDQRGAWRVWEDHARFTLLASNTVRLLISTLLLAVPAGTLLAFLLYRTDLPLAAFWRLLLVLTLFVPLPLFASAWQATLGAGGLLPAAPWSTPPPTAVLAGEIRPSWKPWVQGVPAAAWVHAAAALPWVILIVGHGFYWVERELEEDALTAAGSWRVVWHVSLPRCRASLAVATLWTALMAGTEITVVDMMQVRTLAEEVYLQFNLFDEAGLARTVAAALPVLVCAGLLLSLTLRRWERTLPPLQRWTDTPRVFPLGRWRWPILFLVGAGAVCLFAVPVASLVWRAGLAGTPEAWSVRVVLGYLRTGLHTSGTGMLASVSVAGAAGLVAAALGLTASWLALDSRRFQGAVLVLITAAWVVPAPVLGLGLKAMIQQVLSLEDALCGPWLERAARPLGRVLYDGPSPLPVFWAYLIRFFPFAVAVQWPVVRQIPRELRESLRIDGATAWQEFRHLVLPLCWPALLRAALAVAVLALGEIGASKLVQAAWEPFAHTVFGEMHYGVSNTLAAQCLLLLVAVLLGGLAAALLRPRQELPSTNAQSGLSAR